jgi:hypothetical protein
MKLSVEFGALAPRLTEQLAAAKLFVDKSSVAHFQRDADAIARLSVRGLLSERETKAARRRLLKRMASKARAYA